MGGIVSPGAFEDRADRSSTNPPTASSPLLGHPSPSLPGEVGAWTVELGVDAFPFLADHRLRGTVVLPGAAMVEMALAAATASTGSHPCALDEVKFERICVLSPTGVRRLRVALRAGRGADLAVTVAGGSPGAPATAHATAKVMPCTGPSGAQFDVAAHASEVRRAGAEIPGETFYDSWRAVGNGYGPTFRTLRHLWRRSDGAVALLSAAPAAHADRSGWLAHPVILDAAVQLVAATAGVTDQAFVWAGCERVRLADRLPAEGQAYARARRGADAGQPVGDAFVLGPTGRVLAEITGVRLHLLRAGSSRHRGGKTAAVSEAVDESRRYDGRILVDGDPGWRHARS